MRITSKRRAHEELDLFQLSKRLAVELYRETESFPMEERFGLTSQIRRAAVSVPANIAEGAARGSKRELSRFLLVARGSATELDVLLQIARETGILSDQRFEHFQQTLERVFAMTSGLVRSSSVSRLTSHVSR